MGADLRALGPHLEQYGVAGALAEPQVTIYDGGGKRYENQRPLAPGTYTVHVTGKNDSEGVVLLEIYEGP
ncbi:hypothetical protein DB347_13880 [Opitutaceae bacterium EW11]|nr:hypothetical protein DB347_13880 [Opitutaceae bacterium EW11]